VEASDWDDPLDTAVLYKDTTGASSGCGHALQWNATKLITLKNCPICQEPVTLICDGSTAIATGDDAHASCITFKYGKQIYRLSVEKSSSSKESKEEASKSTTSSSFWESISSFVWKSHNSNKPNINPTMSTVVTAQHRIAQALGLVGLKVLHKGKVLYPDPQNKSSPYPEDAEEISLRLLDLSEIDWNSNHIHQAKRKASLVVMGTLQGHELASRPPEEETFKKSFPSWQQLVRLPFHIAYWGIHSGWLLIRTFLAPFLPRSLTTSTSSEQEDRPHQE
jgi:hypothetical protein